MKIDLMNLILLKRDGDEISAIQQVAELREQALILAARVGAVKTAAQQETAVTAQRSLKEFLDVIEKSRVFVKAPVLELCQKIDEIARRESQEVLDEMTRISAAIGTFQEMERSRVRAAEALRLKDLDEIERNRQTELSMAENSDAAARIQEKFDAIRAAIPLPSPVKSDGQRIREDWELIIVDNWALAAAHPACVEIKPRIREIKALLRAGIKVAGVIAKPIIKSS